jgi:transposase
MVHLRRALYMPALVASRFEPHLRGFYEHLLARGKSKRQARKIPRCAREPG